MASRLKRLLLAMKALVLAIVIGAVLLGCAEEPETVPSKSGEGGGRLAPGSDRGVAAENDGGEVAETDAGQVAEPARFVGVDQCAGCHPDQAALWRGSHHDLAIQEAGPQTLLGDFDGAQLEHFGVTTRFSRRDRAFLVTTRGIDGAPVELEVAYAFGVHPLQQLLVRLPGGRLQALPMAWDARARSDGGQRWFHLYPNEDLAAGDPLHWAGPNQNWNHMCAECHSTQLHKAYREQADRYETSFAELDVACEACHGPGSQHTEWARRAAAEPGRASSPPAALGLPIDLAGARGEWLLAEGQPIAARAAPAERSEVEMCARCHSRRGTLTPDYVHGRPLLDTHRPALLEEGLYHADGQILDEVYVWGSFLQSAMYAAGVSCSDCHDPHSLEVRGGADGVCASCHRPEVFDTMAHHHHPTGSAGSRCVACHMPESIYMSVDGRRDHAFKVPRPDLAAALGLPHACGSCHAERGASWAADVVAGWRGGSPPAHFATVLDAGRRRQPDASRTLARLADDRSQPGIVRATALHLLALQPAPPPEATLEMAAGSPDPLLRMAAARASEALPADPRVRIAAPLLQDPLLAVRVEAARVLADLPTGRWTSEQRAAREGALAEYREVLALDADRPEAQLAMGLLHARQGELDQAEASYRRALDIYPAGAVAHVNLADLHRMQGRDAQAEQVLSEGLALAPGNADLEHALGLVLVRLGRRPEALEALERAATLAPERARYAYVYAVALAGEGGSDRALSVLEEAQARHPADAELLLALSTLSRDAGDQQAARRWARELVALRPGDPQARSLLDSLSGGGVGR
jgi:Tfp pilus assembly protein PilF